MANKFSSKIEKFPPVLCRLLAKSSFSRAATNKEIAERSGLEEIEVVTLSKSVTWNGVDMQTMRRFSEACGIDFDDIACMKRLSVYLRGKKVKGYGRKPPPFEYLRRSPEWDSFFRPLMLLYAEHLKRQCRPPKS